jgi:hypothetical protein
MSDQDNFFKLNRHTSLALHLWWDATARSIEVISGIFCNQLRGLELLTAKRDGFH